MFIKAVPACLTTGITSMDLTDSQKCRGYKKLGFLKMIDGVYSKRQKLLVHLGCLSELVFKQKEIKDEFCNCLNKKHTPQSDSWITCVLLSLTAHPTTIFWSMYAGCYCFSITLSKLLYSLLGDSLLQEARVQSVF